MQKFSELPYQRPDMEAFENDFNALLDDFKNAGSAEEQGEKLAAINKLRNQFDTMANLASIRHSIDTRDKFYEAEQDFFDENSPTYSGLVTRFYRLLADSKYREELEQTYGKQLFDIAESLVRTYSDAIVDGLKEENALATQYTKLNSSASVEFEGEERNLSEFGPFEKSTDRDMRKRATWAKFSWFDQNKEKYDELYDKLVKVRTKIARELGYKNFIGLVYDRMMRTEYGPEEVAAYREQIHKYVVPVAHELRKRQAKRLGLEQLNVYDENLDFTSGNAAPKGDPEWIMDNGSKMYKELSPETDEFFSFMRQNELMDLVAKKGKAPGGYCNELPEYKAPFIFSNFNGTSDDIDVLTHEAGHAFQCYMSRNFKTQEYVFPTYEACEIHSMSMEFFTWPWMELFFKEETDKYKFGHLSSSILFLPYGAAIDEFQHAVFEKPEMTPEERNQTWRHIEQKYLPWRNYDGNEYLESGRFWQRQAHLFFAPFYYIDYTLAQVCAFQFWKRSLDEREKAWSDYINLCKAGGSKPFLQLVDLAGLQSPFEPECIPAVMHNVKAWLNQVDDSQL